MLSWRSAGWSAARRMLLTSTSAWVRAAVWYAVTNCRSTVESIGLGILQLLFWYTRDYMTHTITLIPGDGIGPEVTEAVVRILDGRRRLDRMGDARRRRARVRAHGTGAAGGAHRLDPPQQGRAERAGDDADRDRVHERQRRAAQGARSVREPAAGLEPARRRRRGSRASTSSSSARTPRISTPGSSTKSCPASSRA